MRYVSPEKLRQARREQPVESGRGHEGGVARAASSPGHQREPIPPDRWPDPRRIVWVAMICPRAEEDLLLYSFPRRRLQGRSTRHIPIGVATGRTHYENSPALWLVGVRKMRPMHLPAAQLHSSTTPRHAPSLPRELVHLPSLTHPGTSNRTYLPSPELAFAKVSLPRRLHSHCYFVAGSVPSLPLHRRRPRAAVDARGVVVGSCSHSLHRLVRRSAPRLYPPSSPVDQMAPLEMLPADWKH